MLLQLLAVMVTASVNDAARILAVFPTPSISHQVVFRPLTQELARRGHEVIVVTTDPAFPKGQTPPNLTEIDVHDISYEIWRKHVIATTTGKSNDTFTQIGTILRTVPLIFHQQILNEEVKSIIDNGRDSFDLLLLETCTRPCWVLSHIIKAPTISVSSFGSIFGVMEALGAPNHPMLYPSMLRQKLHNLALWETLTELYNHYYFENLFEKLIESEDEANKRLFGPDMPSVRDLLKNFEMVFLNVHPIWEGNRPVPPNMVFMGGMHQKPEKELPELKRTRYSMLFRVLVLSVVVLITDAARILGFFPTPSISHQVAFRALTQELAKRGHEVVVVTTDPAFPKGDTPKNLTEIDVHDVSYEAWRKNFLVTTTGKNDDTYTQTDTIMNLFGIIFEKQLMNDEVRDIIKYKNDTFDLMLLELCVRPAWVLTNIIKAPTILVSSLGGVLGVYEALGAPVHPLLYPESVRQKLYNLSFWEKIVELYNHYYFQYMFQSWIVREDKLNRRLFGPETPSVSELLSNMEMLFLNVHPIWEGNRPMPPNAVFMGGIHQKPVKELPKDLKTYLDSSKNGVIYISFGTNVMPSMLPPERIQILVRVFSKLPYDVLWKYDKDALPGKSNNIRLEKWLPQSDLLRHPKIKVFITQGGLQSTDEAITAGVPLIGVPMLGDQWYNVDHYVQHKIGVRVDMESITEENFMDAIKTVVEDDSYRKNIVHLRELMNDQPQKPLERAVWWAEHVIRHKGAKHLKAAGANLTWAQYYEIELVSIILGGLLTIVLAISFILYLLWKYISRNFITTVKFKKA